MASTDEGSPGFPEQALTESLPCYYEAPKPPPNAYDRMVTVVVGPSPDAKTFQVHRGLVSHHSGLFRTLLKGRLGTTESHSLPCEKSETFQLFVDWLYSGEVFCDGAMDLTPKAIVELYFFADAYMVQQLKDRALELYFLRFLKDWEAPQDLTRVLYEKTADKSALRKLHVDLLMETFGFENLRDYMHADPKEFFIDLLEASRDEQVCLGNCSAFDGLAEWIAQKKARFCELYHEHPRLDAYPIYESTSDVSEQNSATNDTSDKLCFGCGEAGHIRRECLNPVINSNIKCWNCDKKGHRFRECPEPRDWSRLQCRICRERGHTDVRCPYTVAEEGAEAQDEEDNEGFSGGFGGDLDETDSWGEPVRRVHGGWGQ